MSRLQSDKATLPELGEMKTNTLRNFRPKMHHLVFEVNPTEHVLMPEGYSSRRGGYFVSDDPAYPKESHHKDSHQPSPIALAKEP